MIGNHNLVNGVQTQLAVTVSAGASGTSTLTSSAIDMLGYDGLYLQVIVGPVTSGSATTFKVQQSSDDGGSDGYSDILGSSQAVADTDDDTIFQADFYRPEKRYLKVVVTRATQASTVVVVANKYRAGVEPTLVHATAHAAEIFATPAEGTA